MDNWKIQLFVVSFCALVQTQQALSSTGEEERGLSKDWQVSIRGFMFLSEMRENTAMDKYDLIVFIAEMFKILCLNDNTYQGI